MDPTEIFSSKAAQYACYRWDYAPDAIQRIFQVTGIGQQSLVADIGAGTGILTHHFAGRCRWVYAIEPNAAMRTILAQTLGAHPGCLISAGRAEATGLPDHSLDLVTVAQALNWFDPLPARSEFRRILKPGGWLAAIRNLGGYDEPLDSALETIYPKETAASAWMIGNSQPVEFYYGSDFIQESFVSTQTQTWDEFIGSLSTASYAPDEGSPYWLPFESAARQLFDRYSEGGGLVARIEAIPERRRG